MPKISSYLIDGTPTALDKVIGSDSDNALATMNYSIGDIVGLASFNVYGNTGASQTVNNNESLFLLGGVGIDSVASNINTVTFNLDLSELPASSNISDADYFAVTSGTNQHKIDPGDVPVTSFGAATVSLNMGNNKIVSLANPTAATDAATKSYVDTAFVGSGLLIFQGGYDATGAPPTGAGVETGFTYSVTVAGDGLGFWSPALAVGDVIISNQDNPTLESQWTAVNNNVSLATPTIAGIASFPTDGGLSVSTGVVSLDTQTSNGTFGDAANSATLTIDTKGIVTASSQSAIAITASQVTDFCTEVAACATPSENLSNSNLIQTVGQNRTYSLGDQTMRFTGNTQDTIFSLDGTSGNNSINTGLQVPIRFLDGNVNYVGLQSPAIVSTSYTLTLPTADGTVGQVLNTNGAGQLAWVDAASTDNLATSDLVQTGGVRTYDISSGVLIFGNNGGTTPLFSLNSSAENAISISNQATLRFEPSVLNGPYAGIKAPASLAGSYTLTLPENDGNANEVLQTDGSGVLSWVSQYDSTNLGTSDLVQTGTDRSYTMTSNSQSLSFFSTYTNPVLKVNANPPTVDIFGKIRFGRQLSGPIGYLTLSVDPTIESQTSYEIQFPGNVPADNQYLANDPGTTGVLAWIDPASKVNLGTAPASATSTGAEGDVVWTVDYIYVCIATNTWKRVAIATW